MQQKAEKRPDLQGILLTFIILLQPLNQRCITFTGRKKKNAAYLAVFTALFANIRAAFYTLGTHAKKCVNIPRHVSMCGGAAGPTK